MAAYSRLAQAMMAPAPEPQRWNERVIDPMIQEEGPGYVIHPDTVMQNLEWMRDYPMQMTEAGDLFSLMPPQAGQWSTETIPADPWNTKVIRGR